MQPQMLAPFTPFLITFTKELSDWFEFFKGVKGVPREVLPDDRRMAAATTIVLGYGYGPVTRKPHICELNRKAPYRG